MLKLFNWKSAGHDILVLNTDGTATYVDAVLEHRKSGDEKYRTPVLASSGYAAEQRTDTELETQTRIH